MTEKIKVSAKENSLNAIRYAAYAQTAEYFVLISAVDGNGDAEISFSPKKSVASYDFKEQFVQALKDEKIREKNASENISSAKMILNSVFKRNKPAAQEIPEVPEDTAGSLTPEQEQELDALIAEVEKELQAEMKDSKKDEDPQNITKTWEEMNKDVK